MSGDAPFIAGFQARTTAALKLRDDGTAEPLLVIPQGVLVDVWAVVDGWGRVQTAEGVTGWASMDYLKVVGGEA